MSSNKVYIRQKGATKSTSTVEPASCSWTGPIVYPPLPIGVCSGGKDKCLGDKDVYLSLRAYPIVVRQVGDVVNWYFKITNLTSKTIVGPIDFYISGAEEAIATIDELPALGYYDLLIEDTVDELDITKRFIVATVWARLRSTGCQLGNVVESEVAVEQVQEANQTLEFANPTLLITATETTLDIQAGIDIINLSLLAVESLIIDLSVIFGKDTALSYLIDGQPSNIFSVANGVLSLAEGQTIGANQRISLLVTNVDKTINLDGFCDQSCESTASWRLSGRSTINTSLAWVGATPAPPTVGSGFSAVKLETTDQVPLGVGPLQGWAATPRDANPLYVGTFNDGGFNEITGIYTVPVSGRYLLTANVNLGYAYTVGNLSGNDTLRITADGRVVAASVLSLIGNQQYTPPGAIISSVIEGEENVDLSRVVYLDAGAIVVLSSATETGVAAYYSTANHPMTFSATFLGAISAPAPPTPLAGFSAYGAVAVVSNPLVQTPTINYITNVNTVDAPYFNDGGYVPGTATYTVPRAGRYNVHAAINYDFGDVLLTTSTNQPPPMVFVVTRNGASIIQGIFGNSVHAPIPVNANITSGKGSIILSDTFDFAPNDIIRLGILAVDVGEITVKLSNATNTGVGGTYFSVTQVR